MAVLWSPESGHIKELAKWEIRPTDQVSAGMLAALGKPIVPPHQEYPKMLYKAAAKTGGPVISGHILAHSGTEEASLMSRGWSLSQEAAIDAVTAHEQAIAHAAAERAFAERRMSANAQAEARAADDATSEHVPVVEQKPIRKSHHKQKAAPEKEIR